MRVISLAVDGIFQAQDRGLFQWLATQDAEIICLQDLRAREHQLADHPDLQLDGYFSYFFDAPDPERNGVAIYTRAAPKAIMYGFGLPCGLDMDGRYLQADFEKISIGSLLAPGGRGGPGDLENKRVFFRELQNHLLKIDRKRRRYILCGDWQMAHLEKDVQHPERQRDKPGFLPEERQWLSQLYSEIGYCDAFRWGNSDSDEYSWWPEQDCGMRVDLQVISADLARQVEYAVIYKAQSFSSHAAVIVDYDIESL